MRFLLVEDAARLRQLLSDAVHAAGWNIDAVDTAADAREVIATTPYDLYLVDLGLPDGDGLDLVRSISLLGTKAPVLVLTARGALEDRVAGLDSGADDYLVKPFNAAELLARCRALLRRSPLAVMPVMTLGRLAFDSAQGRVTCDGQDLGLTTREKSVLEALMREAGRVVAKRRLEHSLSEFGEEFSSNAVELTVSRLRRKLEGCDTGTSLETVRGVGYLLTECLP
ncbi:response regulator [Sediminicoccus sp. BL-A-41-H5]|uniref:response regulator n=1 Tax=Sediminicoccus sp. BL-A-41-H5 TaxID=3421106 RepID=UPI003D67860B